MDMALEKRKAVLRQPFGGKNRGDRDSAPRGLVISSVNLSANKRYRALINRSRVPCLDRHEIAFPGLVSRAGAPAMSLKEICC
jgi:hypothetical protein